MFLLSPPPVTIDLAAPDSMHTLEFEAGDGWALSQPGLPRLPATDVAVWQDLELGLVQTAGTAGDVSYDRLLFSKE